ncbi:MAG: hypothetical protein H6696_08835 [Deferribacteres bacterium]|nr:hypothetical protein [Deferribacteres bacterium]
MRSKLSCFLYVVFLFALIFACSGGGNEKMANPKIEVKSVENEQRVDVTIDGQLFTSFLYTDTIPDLKKPCFSH